MRVLYLLGAFPVPPLGGVELSIYEVARDEARRGADVRVVAPSPEPRRLVLDLVEFLGVPVGAISNWIQIPSPASYRALHDTVTWAEIVHVWNPQEVFNLIGIGLALRLGRPLVLSTPVVSSLARHPRRPVRWAGRVDDGIVHRALRRAALVHVQSREEERVARQWSPRVCYIPGGVPDSVLTSPPLGASFRAAHALAGRRPVLLFLGRCHPLKGPEWLVRAMPAVRRALPDASAVIVGPDVDGSLDRLRRLAAELGVADHVQVLGPVDERERVGALDAADVVVVPSRADFVEGFSLVVSEAWARGKPVAAFPVGALRERIRTGENGWLAADLSADALAVAIEGAAGLGPFARPRDVIGWREVAGEFDRRYREILERTSVPSEAAALAAPRGGDGSA
ncbi:MAG TPA: glycosyltransferase family 4 protein [Thermoplasmata archaeon]|nr:glycosyltransferase family 4 protein [Thermoplasmata archaeon]